ncbi:hypothetical protein WSM22_35860 [Cytophagales bacterium WSM2-2]|nr:hypothetical protein WSM22_35860 [Cytophagales bacterium WSM2-2]
MVNNSYGKTFDAKNSKNAHPELTQVLCARICVMADLCSALVGLLDQRSLSGYYTNPFPYFALYGIAYRSTIEKESN